MILKGYERCFHLGIRVSEVGLIHVLKRRKFFQKVLFFSPAYIHFFIIGHISSATFAFYIFFYMLQIDEVLMVHPAKTIRVEHFVPVFNWFRNYSLPVVGQKKCCVRIVGLATYDFINSVKFHSIG